MKIRIEAKPFAEAAHWVSRALPARPPVPVLGGIVLEADTHGTVDGLIVSGFDYETSARIELDATVGEPGRVLVSGRLLADITKSLPDKPVDLTADGARLTLMCGTARFSLPLMPVDEYPQLPALPDRTGSVPGDVWAAAVGQVTMAAGRDDSLPMLTGVRVELDGDKITMAATDRFRLAVRELTWTPDQPDLTAAVLLPARTLAELAKTLAGAGTLDISIADGRAGMVGFAAGGRRATTRVLDNEFPRFRQLIPAAHSTTCEVEVTELQAALKRMALVTDRATSAATSTSSTRRRPSATRARSARGTGTQPVACSTKNLQVKADDPFLGVIERSRPDDPHTRVIDYPKIGVIDYPRTGA